MVAICTFNCKIRKSASGQTIVTIPHHLRKLVGEDQPVTVEILRRKERTQQAKLKKEVANDKHKSRTN